MTPDKLLASTGYVSNKNAQLIVGGLLMMTLVYSIYNYHTNIKLNKLRYDLEKHKIDTI